MENVKEYVEKFTTFGDPVDFKGLKIKPITVRDAEKFLDAVGIFKIEKNKIPSIEVIQMSYLEFLIGMLAMDEDYRDAFLWLIQTTLGMEYNDANKMDGDTYAPNELLAQVISDGNAFYYINGWDLEVIIKKGRASIRLMDATLNASEFDTFRKIILFQNIDGYDDTEMSDDFRRVVEQYYALKFKGVHDPTLEEKMMAVMVSTSYTLDSLAKMPYRTFDKLFDCSIKKVDYMATKMLEPHLKEGHSIDHWVFYPERDKYANIFGDAQELAKKVTSI